MLRVDFDTVKAAAKKQDVTINDLFVTAAARAAGEVHRRAGQPVDELRMAMPMSTRDDKSAAGNAFSLTRSLVPVDIDDPETHLQAVHELLAATRGEKAFQVLDQLAGVMNVLPTSALVSAARHQAETVDFTTSNLRGAPFPLFFGGAQIVENYPVGPLAGTAFNLTMLSYDGELHLGLLVDTRGHPRRGGTAGCARGRVRGTDVCSRRQLGETSSDCFDRSVRTSSSRSATSLVETSWRSCRVPRP